MDQLQTGLRNDALILLLHKFDEIGFPLIGDNDLITTVVGDGSLVREGDLPVWGCKRLLQLCREEAALDVPDLIEIVTERDIRGGSELLRFFHLEHTQDR